MDMVSSGKASSGSRRRLSSGSMSAEQLLAVARPMMADYKVPRHVTFVDDFPRTTTGKIQRFVLQRQAREQIGG